MENQTQHSKPTFEKELALWEMSDKAQLERFRMKYQGSTLVIGFRNYEVIGSFMNENQRPYLELLSIEGPNEPRQWTSAPLSLIDNEYEYFSSYDWEGRYKLLAKLGINPDEVKV